MEMDAQKIEHVNFPRTFGVEHCTQFVRKSPQLCIHSSSWACAKWSGKFRVSCVYNFEISSLNFFYGVLKK